MKTLKKFAFEHPVIFSFILMSVSIGMTFIPLNQILLCGVSEQTAEYTAGVIEQTLVSILLIILLSKMQLLKEAGFRFKVKQILIVWPMLLIIVLNSLELIDGTVRIDTTQKTTIIMYILVYLSTGLFEETLCRGVVQTLLIRKWGQNRKGIYLSVIMGSLLFGLFHIIHFFMGQMTLLASMTQVIYAFFIGVFMGACVLRNQSVIPAIIVHGLVDITGSLNEIAVNGGIPKEIMTISVPDAMISIALMSPLLFYGLFIMRKCTGKEMVHSENN